MRVTWGSCVSPRPGLRLTFSQWPDNISLVTMCCLTWDVGPRWSHLLRGKVGQWPQLKIAWPSHAVTSVQTCRVNGTNREIKHVRVSSDIRQIEKHEREARISFTHFEYLSIQIARQINMPTMHKGDETMSSSCYIFIEFNFIGEMQPTQTFGGWLHSLVILLGSLSTERHFSFLTMQWICWMPASSPAPSVHWG